MKCDISKIQNQLLRAKHQQLKIKNEKYKNRKNTVQTDAA